MLKLEHDLRYRLPWLAGHPVALRTLASVLKRIANEDRFNLLLERSGHARGLDFVDRMLELLGTSGRVDAGFSGAVPAKGPLLVVANHPLGMQDALALLQWLGSIRPDVRILGNNWLASVPQLGDLLLPVDVFSPGTGSGPRNIYRALENGEALVVFPAGEVSRVRTFAVRDGPWSEGFARLSSRSRAPVLPVHVRAKNSTMFYAASMLFRPLGTALLPREATAPGGRRIALRPGPVITADELEQRSGGSSRQAAKLVRRQVYQIGRLKHAAAPLQAPLAPAGRKDEIVSDISRAEQLAQFGDGRQLYLFTGGLDSALMRDIGRLRELTFRKVGEGTGQCRDLDPYDARYEHLVLWDAKAQCVAGSYRLGNADRLTGAHDTPRLYTATLFDFSAVLQSRLRHGLELGRSFVTPDYWGSRALDQLWQGIGLYLQRHPEVHHLFGAVSMPITLPREAREWIAAAHLQYFGTPDHATARHPFIVSPEIVRQVEQACDGLDPPAGMARLKQHLDTLGVSLPVLYRRYVDLVEPGGVQFLAFGDDPGFSGCVDGLVWMDVASLKQRTRARYLGRRSLATSAAMAPRRTAEMNPAGAAEVSGKTSQAADGALVASR